MEAIQTVIRVQNIRYDKETEALYIIDQTLLPNEEREIRLETAEEMYNAIKALRVRGAPAIGICAAYSLYALARTIEAEDSGTFLSKLREYGGYLEQLPAHGGQFELGGRGDAGDGRSTIRARNGRMLLEALYQKAAAIHEDDIAKVHELFLSMDLTLVKDGDGILTHCNAGPLATSRYGTALGPILLGNRAGHDLPRVLGRDPSPAAGGPAHQLRAATGRGWM